MLVRKFLKKVFKTSEAVVNSSTDDKLFWKVRKNFRKAFLKELTPTAVLNTALLFQRNFLKISENK